MIILNGQEVCFGSFPNGETNMPLHDLSLNSLSIVEYNTVKLVYKDDAYFKISKERIEDVACQQRLFDGINIQPKEEQYANKNI